MTSASSRLRTNGVELYSNTEEKNDRSGYKYLRVESVEDLFASSVDSDRKERESVKERKREREEEIRGRMKQNNPSGQKIEVFESLTPNDDKASYPQTSTSIPFSVFTPWDRPFAHVPSVAAETHNSGTQASNPSVTRTSPPAERLSPTLTEQQRSAHRTHMPPVSYTYRPSLIWDTGQTRPCALPPLIIHTKPRSSRLPLHLHHWF